MPPLLFALISFFPAVLPGEATFLEANAAQQAGHWEAAARAYEACGVQDTVLLPYTEIHRAQCYTHLKDSAAAMALYEAVIRHRGAGPWTRMARLHGALLLADLGRHHEAEKWFEEALDVDPQPWWMEDYAWTAAEHRLKHGAHPDKALAWFRETAETTILYRKRLDASAVLLDTSNSEYLLPALAAFLRSSAYEEAKSVWAKAPAAFHDEGGGVAGFETIEARLSEIDDSAARIQWVTRMQAANADNPWFTQWLVYAMRMSAVRRDYAEAMSLCVMVASAHPEAREAGDSLWWLARYLEREGRKGDAFTLYRNLIEQCPEHYRADDALLESARLLEEQGKAAEAREAYASVGQVFPESALKARAYHTAALLAQKAGDEKKTRLYLMAAVQKGLGNFHAHRALRRVYDLLGLPNERTVNLRLDGKDGVLQPYDGVAIQAPLLEVPDDPRVERLRFFGRHGLEAGRWEALHLLETLADAPEAAGYYALLADAGYAHSALRFALANPAWKCGPLDPARLRLEYPLAYREEAARVARELDLDPRMILAVARQESTFRADIRSRSGATGVMQLMPATAKWLAKVDDRISADAPKNLESPAYSVRLGGVYLKRMIERSGGNWIYALASYNAGPGNCDKWRKKYPNADTDAFIEVIGFDETRDYVKRVLANYATYRSLYPVGADDPFAL